MFTSKRYCTAGVSRNVPEIVQAFMWNLIDKMNTEKDYLQVFRLSEKAGKQLIIHSQECPEYEREHCIELCGAPVFVGKIFAIDDKTHSTMLLAEEY